MTAFGQPPSWRFAAAPAALDIDLESSHGRQLLAATAQRYGAPLAIAARRLDRLFLLRSPWAPGLRFVGGQAAQAADGHRHAFSLSGPGETIEAALASCLGEGVELLSQVERAEDCAMRAPLADVAGRLTADVERLVRDLLAGAGRADLAIDWKTARTRDGGEVLIPADWCLRRAPQRATLAPPWKLGAGVAAGPTWERAAIRAVLELIERDAVALWWQGGRRGRPLALHDPAVAEAARLSSLLRQGQNARTGWLLDITTDLAVPCVAALSTDPDGRGLACGFAARPTFAEAVHGALLENAQMELALLLDSGRRAADGEAERNNPDAGATVRLATRVDAATCDLLHPLGAPRLPSALPGGSPLEQVTARLSEHGIEVAFVEHTRPDIGISVVRAVATGLQPIPSPVVTPRLRDVVRETGGGGRFTHGLSLF